MVVIASDMLSPDLHFYPTEITLNHVSQVHFVGGEKGQWKKSLNIKGHHVSTRENWQHQPDPELKCFVINNV